MKKTFDPLILITKGNEEIKNAYKAGVEFGRTKEKEVFETMLKDLYAWIEKRVVDIEKKVLPERNNKSGIKPKEKHWYIAGHIDVKKMIKKVLTY